MQITDEPSKANAASNKKKTATKPKERPLCTHDVYDMRSYGQEGHSGYFKPGEQLSGLQCALCPVWFVDKLDAINEDNDKDAINEDNDEQDKQTVPSWTKPCYVCFNRVHEEDRCLHIVCNPCFTERLVKNNAGGRATRSRSRG
jgi:hypothetical protein